ncbi:hypothetical protein P4U05_16265 [Bacillus paranthracis]|nr:hypothetical protein [Bacillus paranthracis]MCW4576949.1 hypothetical protein [Bacillus pacificus]MDA1584204.1 hypothetical protein [Bacillus cereus group sp. TH230-1LC]MCR6799470.1 hypothetical protein [Bacillus paranthracis]MEC3358350.1 hypothetical protein [Bacillus paranthracis]MED0785188.1 hypothetical protein [Bacillus paranthracis]
MEGIELKKIFSSLSIIFILIILGGCNMNDDKKEEEQKIVKKAEEVTIKYFKEKENLEVIITGHKFAPSNFQTVFINGHIKDDESKTFSADVEYGGEKYHVSSMSHSKNLELKN